MIECLKFSIICAYVNFFNFSKNFISFYEIYYKISNILYWSGRLESVSYFRSPSFSSQLASATQNAVKEVAPIFAQCSASAPLPVAHNWLSENKTEIWGEKIAGIPGSTPLQHKLNVKGTVHFRYDTIWNDRLDFLKSERLIENGLWRTF